MTNSQEPLNLLPLQREPFVPQQIQFVTMKTPYQPDPTMKPRYKRLLVALLAALAIYAARETGLDRGLVDAVMDGVIEAVYPEDSE